jgi:hypothetical protein
MNLDEIEEHLKELPGSDIYKFIWDAAVKNGYEGNREEHLIQVWSPLIKEINLNDPEIIKFLKLNNGKNNPITYLDDYREKKRA